MKYKPVVDEEEQKDESQILVSRRYVASHGGITAKMDIPPPKDEHRSKRYGVYLGQVKDLDVNREFLRRQAIEKDRIFKKDITELRMRIDHFKGRVAREAEERTIQETTVEKEIAEKVKAVEDMFVAELKKSYDKVANEWIPPPIARVEAWKKDFDYFVHVTIPTTIENQSGRVTRHLIKSQETFEIDNTKLWKREMKIVDRFEKHKEKSLENISEMKAKRDACFVLLDEDIEEVVRMADKSEERFTEHICHRLKQVQDMESGLAGVRQDTDSFLLVAIEEAMRKVQENIIKNFGLSNTKASLSNKK